MKAKTEGVPWDPHMWNSLKPQLRDYGGPEEAADSQEWGHRAAAGVPLQARPGVPLDSRSLRGAPSPPWCPTSRQGC